MINDIVIDRKQLDLFSNRTEDSLRRLFENSIGRPVNIVLTENTTTMLSVRIIDGAVRVRLHRMFLSADDAVIREIQSFLKNRKSDMRLFRQFVRDNKDRLRNRPLNSVSLKPAGRFHDLGELYRETNDKYFGGAVNAAITWGTKSPRFSVRKRTLGSYSERSNIIRINPILDKKSIPRYYVAFVVYHEMLHAALGVPLLGKKRSVHSKEFRAREKCFSDYEKAIAWERGKT